MFDNYVRKQNRRQRKMYGKDLASSSMKALLLFPPSMEGESVSKNINPLLAPEEDEPFSISYT